jgi:hypothetical protein
VLGFGLKQLREDATGPLLGGELANFFALEGVGKMSHFVTGQPNLIGPPGTRLTGTTINHLMVGFGIKGLGDSAAHTFWKKFLDKFLFVGGEGCINKK